MENDRWYEKLESNIFTVVSYRAKTAIGNSVSNTIKFTTEGQSDSTPYFPTCYIHELSPIESGNDLEGKAINAVMETIEIIVYARSKAECKLIMNEAVYQMKRLSFAVTAMPISSESDKVYSSVCRFRRLIGADDTDLIQTA